MRALYNSLHQSLGTNGLIALVLSLTVHIFILNIYFDSRPPISSSRQSDNIEVVLTNARHDKAPKNAKKLAQANLQGGGTHTPNSQLSSPIFATTVDAPGNDLINANKRVEVLKDRQQQLLLAAKQQNQLLSARMKKLSETPDSQPAETKSDDNLRQIMARITAEIQRQISTSSNAERQLTVGSETREYVFARYIESVRKRIETVGTENFPAEARGKYYGNVLVSIAIRADGTVQKITIHKSSGFAVLDRAVRDIINLSAPFEPFTPEMQEKTDVLRIVRSWNFTNSERLNMAAGNNSNSTNNSIAIP